MFITRELVLKNIIRTEGTKEKLLCGLVWIPLTHVMATAPAIAVETDTLLLIRSLGVSPTDAAEISTKAVGAHSYCQSGKISSFSTSPAAQDHLDQTSSSTKSNLLAHWD